MKLYAPKYYKSFSCIADKCTHSCCVGWEIDIDDIAMKKYSSFTCGYGKTVADSIEAADTPFFRLLPDGRCPHLAENGLCRIITELGEEQLCDICREHPRFYNDTALGKEVGLGMACEEACRIILSSDGYGNITEISELGEDTRECEFNILPLRERVYSLLSDSAVEYDVRLSNIGKEFGVSLTVLSLAEWRDIISSFEYLCPASKEIFLEFDPCVSTPAGCEKILERALAYYVYRHCSSACDEGSFVAALGFCLFCERLLALLLSSEKASCVEDAVRPARIISEEIEYSEDNTEAVISELSFALL